MAAKVSKIAFPVEKGIRSMGWNLVDANGNTIGRIFNEADADLLIAMLNTAAAANAAAD